MQSAKRSLRAILYPVGIITASILLYLAVAPAGMAPGPASEVAGESSDLRAHEFELLDINPRSASHGRKLALHELYADRGVVLKFLASWCELCRKELPGIEELYARERMPIALMAADEYGSYESLLIVAERNDVTAPILFVPPEQVEEMERYYSHEVLPATYMIDPEGTVRLSHQGTMSKERLVREIESTLGLSSS